MAGWRKSSRSAANGCVEMQFVKSSYSVNLNCVEMEQGVAGVVRVRDSKDKTGDGAIIEFTHDDWQVRVLDPIHNGDFNWNTFLPLQFNEEERRAFILGVLDGEFDLKEPVNGSSQATQAQ